MLAAPPHVDPAEPPHAARAGAAIALVIPGAYLLTSPAALPSGQAPFQWGRPIPTPERGDVAQFVFTRLPIDAPQFEAKARAFIGDRGPATDVNAEDMAFVFTDSLETAQAMGADAPLTTLCLYEDGTPDRWLPGHGDCFGDHLTFSDRLKQAGEQLPRSLPGDVRSFLVLRSLCGTIGGEAAIPPAPSRRDFCRGRDLAAVRDQLESRYPAASLQDWGVAGVSP
ncbi:MAG: hypothetical protein R3E86_22165 [Pseudomonadales bacterium]